MSSAAPDEPAATPPLRPVVTPSSELGRDAIGFVLRLGRALHTYGYSAPRLESVLTTAATRLGLAAPQFFSTPTSLLASFGAEDDQRTYMLRVQPGQHDLGKLAMLDAITLRALRGQARPSDAIEEIERVVAAPRRWGAVLTTLAFGLASAALARFFGGGVREIALGGTVGLAVGGLAELAGRLPALGRVFEPVAAFVATALATMLVRATGPSSLYIVTLSGIIALLPGLMLTIAMSELANQHLAAGTARLSGAIMIFLGIAFGVALGNRAAEGLLGTVVTASPVELPGWTLGLALLTAPLALGVLLRAEPADLPWIIGSGILAFGGARLGSTYLGLGLGSFVGALAVGVASNVYARLLDRPGSVVLVPGLTVLVPGSVGYSSLVLLMEKNVLVGVEAGFRMLLTASSLVAGLLVANVIGPERRSAERRKVPRTA